MTPSTILLSICTSIFFALACTFVAFFIRQSYQKKAFTTMKISKSSKSKIPQKEIKLPTEEQAYQLAKAK